MSEPTGGTPPPPQPPGNWQTPSPSQGGFRAASIEAGPAPGIAYADLVTRVVAYIIDAILLGILSALIFIVLGAIIITSLLTGGVILAFIGFVILAAFSLLASAIYFIYTWTSMRASPGQKILNLETVRAADGATLTREQAIRRWAFLFGPSAVGTVAQLALGASEIAILGTLISLLVLGYTIYLLYTASQSPKRQGYHDVQAGTVVIKRTV